jgi:hypothetical protein
MNIKGIFVGNGVMNFENNELEKSEIQYMIDHNLISSRLEVVYRQACFTDFDSPRCRFFRYEVDILEAYLNPYGKSLPMQISMRLVSTDPQKRSDSKKPSRPKGLSEETERLCRKKAGN